MPDSPRINTLSAMSDGLSFLERSITAFIDHHDQKALNNLPAAREHLNKARKILDKAKHQTGLH